MKNLNDSLLDLKEFEAPGWEQTKFPLVSFVLLSLIGYSLLGFIIVKDFVQTLIKKESTASDI